MQKTSRGLTESLAPTLLELRLKVAPCSHVVSVEGRSQVELASSIFLLSPEATPSYFSQYTVPYSLQADYTGQTGESEQRDVIRRSDTRQLARVGLFFHKAGESQGYIDGKGLNIHVFEGSVELLMAQRELKIPNMSLISF